MKWIWLALLVLLAAYLRVIVLQQTYVPRAFSADAAEYYLTAYNLRQNGIYSRSAGQFGYPPLKVLPDNYRWPGLPLLIAAVMEGGWHPAEDFHRIQTVNLLLGLATVEAIFVAAAAVLPLWGAILVGLLVACSPHLVSFTVYVLTETPSAFLVAALLAASAARRVSFTALGALVGCLCLFRPIFLAFVPVLALAYPGERRSCLLFACLGAAIVVAPWFIHNALIPADKSEPSYLGTVILGGSYRHFVYHESYFPWGWVKDPAFPAAKKSLALAVKEVTRKIGEDPIGMAKWYLLEKPVYLFQWDNIDSYDIFIFPVSSTPFSHNRLFEAIHDAFYYTHAAVLALAAVGAIAAWFSSWPAMRVASLLVVFMYASHIPFAVSTRYAVPVFPAIYLLAVYPIGRSADAIRYIRRCRRAT